MKVPPGHLHAPGSPARKPPACRAAVSSGRRAEQHSSQAEKSGAWDTASSRARDHPPDQPDSRHPGPWHPAGTPDLPSWRLVPGPPGAGRGATGMGTARPAPRWPRWRAGVPGGIPRAGEPVFLPARHPAIGMPACGRISICAVAVAPAAQPADGISRSRAPGPFSPRARPGKGRFPLPGRARAAPGPGSGHLPSPAPRQAGISRTARPEGALRVFPSPRFTGRGGR
jgi:hypothetical protein